MPAQMEALQAAQSVIRGLGLSDIPNDRVVIRKRPLLDGLETPCVVIAPAPERIVGVTNAADDIGYGFFVTIARAGNHELDDMKQLEQELTWRERVRQAFHNKRLPSVTQCVLPSKVEAGEPMIAQMFGKLLDAQYWLVRVPVREVRNAGDN